VRKALGIFDGSIKGLDTMGKTVEIKMYDGEPDQGDAPLARPMKEQS
jgi:hypothetical protein